MKLLRNQFNERTYIECAAPLQAFKFHVRALRKGHGCIRFKNSGWTWFATFHITCATLAVKRPKNSAKSSLRVGRRGLSNNNPLSSHGNVQGCPRWVHWNTRAVSPILGLAFRHLSSRCHSKRICLFSKINIAIQVGEKSGKIHRVAKQNERDWRFVLLASGWRIFSWPGGRGRRYYAKGEECSPRSRALHPLNLEENCFDPTTSPTCLHSCTFF
jgi:hypothetical protein